MTVEVNVLVGLVIPFHTHYPPLLSFDFAQDKLVGPCKKCSITFHKEFFEKKFFRELSTNFANAPPRSYFKRFTRPFSFGRTKAQVILRQHFDMLSVAARDRLHAVHYSTNTNL